MKLLPCRLPTCYFRRKHTCKRHLSANGLDGLQLHTHTHRTRHIIRLSLRSSQSIPPHLFASLPYLSLLFPPQHARNGTTKTRNKTNDKGGGGDFPSHQIRTVCAACDSRPLLSLTGPRSSCGLYSKHCTTYTLLYKVETSSSSYYYPLTAAPDDPIIIVVCV